MTCFPLFSRSRRAKAAQAQTLEETTKRSPGGPPGTPSLIRKFTTFRRTWASDTTCFTVRIKIASSGSLRAAPGGPRRLLEAPRAAPPARVAVRSRKHGTWHVPEAQSDVFSAVFAIPEGESGPNPRGNNEKGAGGHGVATQLIAPPK